MTLRGFFRWIWRFNALIIFGGGIVVSLLAAWGVAQVLYQAVRPRPLPNTAAVGTASVVREQVFVGSFTAVPGTAYYSAPLSAVQDVRTESYSSSYGTKAAGSLRNLILFDSRDGATRRVLPDDSSIMTQLEFVPGGLDNGQRRPARAALFLVHRADADGNRRIDAADPGDLVMAPLDRAGLVTLATGVSRLHGVRETPTGTLVAFVRTGAALRFIEIDPAAAAILRSGAIDLPDLPPS
jgi:hypothetical protein